MARLPEGSEERLFYMKYIETLFRASCSGFISPPPPPPKCINCPENMSSPNYKPFLERTQTEAAQDMLPKPVGGAAGGGNGAGGGSPARGGNGAGGGAGGGTPGRTKGGTKEAIEEVPNEWRGPLKTQNSLAGAQTAHHPLPLTTPGGKGGTGSSSCEVCFFLFVSLTQHPCFPTCHTPIPLYTSHTGVCCTGHLALWHPRHRYGSPHHHSALHQAEAPRRADRVGQGGEQGGEQGGDQGGEACPQECALA